MKKYFAIFILFSMSCGTGFADEKMQPLATQKEKESYSIGYQVGLSMMVDEVDVDFARLTEGLEDAITGTPPPLTAEEMKGLILDLKTKARRIQMQKRQESLVKNNEESERFLDENSRREGVTTTESGLQYQVLEEGGGPIPTLKSSVRVHYTGTFIDGREFDSSRSKGEPQLFRVDSVIKGWIEALQLMKVGSRWKLYVPPSLAYGRGGLGGVIPGNKVLVFDMELVSMEGETQQ